MSSTSATTMSRAGAIATTGGPAVVLAALAWSTNGPAAEVLPGGASPVAVAAMRMLGGGLLLLLSCGTRRIRSLLAGRDRLGPIAGALVAMAVYQGLYFIALRMTGVAVGTVIVMVSIPVFVGLYTFVIGRGRPSARWLLATTLALAGSGCLAFSKGGAHGAHPVGALCALCAGMAYAVFVMISARGIRAGGDARATMAVVLSGAGILLSPALLVTSLGWLGTGRGIAGIGYIALVPTMVAYILYGRGLRVLAATTASTLLLVEPASAAVLGIVVLHETATSRSYLGLVLVGAALVALCLRGRAPDTQPAPDIQPAPDTQPAADIQLAAVTQPTADTQLAGDSRPAGDSRSVTRLAEGSRPVPWQRSRAPRSWRPPAVRSPRGRHRRVSGQPAPVPTAGSPRPGGRAR